MGSMSTMLLGIFGLAGTVLFAIVVRQGADEFKAWTPRLTNKLLERAVLRLPEGKRERYREEWASHINDVPGEAGKWIEACSFLLSAKRIAKVEAPARSRVIEIRGTKILIVGDIDIRVARKILGMSASHYATEILHFAGHGTVRDQPVPIQTLLRRRIIYSIMRSIALDFW